MTLVLLPEYKAPQAERFSMSAILALWNAQPVPLGQLRKIASGFNSLEKTPMRI